MLTLTEDQKMIQDVIRDFAENEIRPIAGKIDEDMTFPEETIKKLGELGFLGVPFPEEYSGAGMDTVSYSIVVEELSKVCASHGITVAAHISLGTYPIYMFGNEDQKRKYLPKLASGQSLASFCLTEPETGSDVKSLKTYAEKVDGGYNLNGGKAFITNAGFADVYIVFAITKKSEEKNEISAFILESNTPGISVAPKEKKMGWRASDTRQVNFDDVFIPDENLLGEEGKGFYYAMEILDGGRISVGALSLGIAEGAYEAALSYAKDRQQFGRPIGKFQAISMMLADMATQIHAAKLMIYEASQLKDAGKDFIKEASMAKLYASEIATSIARDSIQVHGGYGYTKEYPVERLFRDAKACEIGEGTSEIQRLLIAKMLFKE